MLIEHPDRYYRELQAAGMDTVISCDSTGRIVWRDGLEGETGVSGLVLAAHSKLLTSDECLALQAAITQEQWLAYQECRKQPIRQARASRYKEEADPMFLKITEDALKAQSTPDYAEWLALKDKIREALPYPE